MLLTDCQLCYTSANSAEKIAILCAAPNSHYFQLQSKYNLEIYTKADDCRNFQFDCPVITHAPCAQWSRLHKFARVNQESKNLAYFCLRAVVSCGGIFEHPAGSHFFKTAGIDRTQLFSIDQHWFGFPGRKRTYLYSHKVNYSSFPLSLDAIPGDISNTLRSSERELTTVAFNEWLIKSILNEK
jgi:hypothetical protein